MVHCLHEHWILLVAVVMLQKLDIEAIELLGKRQLSRMFVMLLIMHLCLLRAGAPSGLSPFSHLSDVPYLARANSSHHADQLEQHETAHRRSCPVCMHRRHSCSEV